MSTKLGGDDFGAWPTPQLLTIRLAELLSVAACDKAKDAVLRRKYDLQQKAPLPGSEDWRVMKELALVYEKICHRRSELRRAGLLASDRAIAVAAERVLSPDQWRAVLAEARAFELARKRRAAERSAVRDQEKARRGIRA